MSSSEQSILEIVMNFMPAPLLAFATAYLRAVKEGKNMTSRWIEGTMVGLATMGTIPLLEWFQMPSRLALFLGVVFGYVGVDTITTWLKQIMERRINKD